MDVTPHEAVHAIHCHHAIPEDECTLCLYRKMERKYLLETIKYISQQSLRGECVCEDTPRATEDCETCHSARLDDPVDP